MRDFNLFIFSIVGMMLVFSVLPPLIICLVAMLRAKKTITADARMLQTAQPVQGVIADAQLVQDHRPLTEPLHYKYALQYQDRMGVTYRAFLGINRSEPLSFAVGMPIALRVFSQPVMQIPPEAMDPNRGADGRLPGVIRFRQWNNVPMDETGCVMLESDWVRAQGAFETRLRRVAIAQYVAIALLAISVLGFAALAAMFL